MGTVSTNWITPKEWLVEQEGRIGRNKLYDLIRTSAIPHVRLGRKILLPSDFLDRLLESRSIADAP